MNKKIYINGRFLEQEMTGVQRVATEISLYLQDYYNDRIVFVCPPVNLINSHKDKFNCITIGKYKGYIWEQIELPRYLRSVNAQVLVNFSNTAPILFSKNIVVIHDMAIKQNKEWFDWKFIAFYNIMFYFLTKRAKKIVTVSNFSKSEILKYYPDTPTQKVEVVYLASFISPNEQPKKKSEYFIAVNSLNARKNITAIIQAFNILEKDGYRLKIVGGTNEKVFGSNNFNKKMPNIEFLGSIDDNSLKDEILHAHGFINAAWYEGFGLPPLEAMSLKVPCILSDIPVYKELYSKTALFFNPNKPYELADRVRELGSMNKNDYEELCNDSYMEANKFTWKDTARRYIEIIESTING